MSINRLIDDSEASFEAMLLRHSRGAFRLSRNCTLMRHDRPKAGDHVRVQGGVFAGVEGTVERRLDGPRLLIKLHLIQQAVSLEIDDGLIQVLEMRSAPG